MSSRGLVIFDCDGVLVDSEGISTRVLARMIRELGLAITEAETEAEFRGATLGVVADYVERRLGRPAPDAWIHAFRDRRAAALRDELEPVDGAAEAVTGVLADGFEICVASQAWPDKLALVLGLTELDAHFPPERRFSAQMVPRGKPAPDLFLHAAATCGHPVGRCVVVEDTTIGVRAARAAGIRVLAYAGDNDPQALAAVGGEPFFAMRDVPELVAAAIAGDAPARGSGA